MTRYEAYLEKNWRELGLAHLVVARIRDDCSADYGVFLVDIWCLGVKDAFHEAGVSEAALREFVEGRLPEEYREPLHPACAKKLIEGALAYAEGLGFAPHRDFRKARRVLSGIDASVCPMEFTYGKDGRPCYVRGVDDSDERVDRVLAILEERCGLEGFDYDPAGEEDAAEEDWLATREDLLAWLDAEPENVPRFYEVSGLITAMHLCPQVIMPTKLITVLWGPNGRIWSDEEEAQEFATLLLEYWNYIGQLVQDCVAPGASAEAHPVDVWADDFEEGDGMGFIAATFEWAAGFKRATEIWPEAWGNTLSRPDLTLHWEVIGWWANFDQNGNAERIHAATAAKPSRTIASSVAALARALRPAGAPPMPTG